MNKMLDFIKSRRTIRKYKAVQINEEELQAILEAGLYAPSAGGRQSPRFLVLQDPEVLRQLGWINRQVFGAANSDNIHFVSKAQPSIADSDHIQSGFYQAPTVIAILGPKDWYYSVQDCTMAAESMTLMAWSLGIGSCFVSRSEETFATDYGQEILKKANIAEDYEAKVFLTLGYPAADGGEAKPRKPNRIVRL